MSDIQILAATKNAGKIKELSELLKDLPIRLRNLNEFAEIAEPEESGKTFAENAVLKAKYYAEITGIMALADDSGLEVEALGGAPGVFSARYAGENATDAEKTAKLLSELKGKTNRNARFTCAMAIADRKSDIKHIAEGICHGFISLEPRGKNGFGYDPIFIPEGFDKTFGELPGEVKQRISHRARASKEIIRYLQGFIII